MSTEILFGTGELYLGKIEGDVKTATEPEIQAALVNVGAIESGATFTYKPDIYNVESHNRGLLAQFITKEEVTFKVGIIRWNLDNLAKVTPGLVGSNSATKKIKGGGIKVLPVNYLRYVVEKPDGKKLTLNIFKASSTDGFALAFGDQETKQDLTFTALSTGASEGNLFEIIDEVGNPIPAVSAISSASITTADLPEVLTVTGSEFTSGSIVFVEKDSVQTELRTLFDSATQLTAIVKDLVAGAYTVKVKNGTSVSTTSKPLTIS